MSTATTPAHVQPPWRTWLGSLRLRLALASVLFISACVALSTHLVLQRVQAGVQKAVMDMETGNAERMASLISGRVVVLQRALRALADDPSFGAVSEDRLALQRRIESSVALRSMFSTVFVADLQGEVLVLADAQGVRPPGVLRIADRTYFRDTLSRRRPVVSEAMNGRVSGEPTVLFTMPVSRGGELVAVLAGSVRLGTTSLLDDLTQRSHVADDPVSTLVIDQRGRVLSHRDPARVMTLAMADPGLAEAVARWDQQGRPIEASGDVLIQADGNVVASAGVPSADWVVFRLAHQNTLLGDVARAHRESLWLAGAVAVTGGLLLLGLLQLQLRPLGQLQRRALTLGHAGLAEDEGWPEAAGEIGQLSTVLRQAMVDRARRDRDAAALLRRMHTVMDLAPIGIALTQDRRFNMVSREFSQLLGWPPGGLEGREAQTIFANQADYDALGPAVGAAFAAGKALVTELQFQRRDGDWLWCRLQGRPVDPLDPNAGTIWLLEDVTAQRAERTRLAWSANHDALTRLANRASFEARLTDWLATTSPAPAGPATLLFMDLDHFKQVNDNAGHAAGDQLLREVAQVLQGHRRGTDVVARIGGDEFALLLVDCSRDNALAVAEQIREGVKRLGVWHEGRWLGIGASLGLVAAEPGDSIDALMRSADAACYEAKRAGRDGVRHGQRLVRVV